MALPFDIAFRRGNDYTIQEQYHTVSGTTVNNTPFLLFESFPFPPNIAVQVTVTSVSVQSDFSTSRSSTTIGTFFRGAGNIAQDGADNITNIGTLAVTPNLTFNTVNQTVQFLVTGPNATTVFHRAVINLVLLK